MPHRTSSAFLATTLPFVPAVAGVWGSVLAFREHHQLAGLACGLGGMLLMLALAIGLGRRTAR